MCMFKSLSELGSNEVWNGRSMFFSVLESFPVTPCKMLHPLSTHHEVYGASSLLVLLAWTQRGTPEDEWRVALQPAIHSSSPFYWPPGLHSKGQKPLCSLDCTLAHFINSWALFSFFFLQVTGLCSLVSNRHLLLLQLFAPHSERGLT